MANKIINNIANMSSQEDTLMETTSLEEASVIIKQLEEANKNRYLAIPQGGTDEEDPYEFYSMY